MNRELFARPCSICGAAGWCPHREPEIVQARLEALARAAERLARALERVKSSASKTEAAA